MSWVRDRLFALVLAIGLLLLAGASYAQTFEAALAGFAADSYSDTEAAIAAVAVSGNPLAVQVINALQDGRLQFGADDKKIYIQTASGALLDAATGAADRRRAAGQSQPGASEQSLTPCGRCRGWRAHIAVARSGKTIATPPTPCSSRAMPMR